MHIHNCIDILNMLQHGYIRHDSVKDSTRLDRSHQQGLFALYLPGQFHKHPCSYSLFECPMHYTYALSDSPLMQGALLLFLSFAISGRLSLSIKNQIASGSTIDICLWSRGAGRCIYSMSQAFQLSGLHFFLLKYHIALNFYRPL